MFRVRIGRLSRLLVGLTAMLVLGSLGAAPAAANAPGKPPTTAAVPGGPGRSALPAGSSACKATATKRPSPAASCQVKGSNSTTSTPPPTPRPADQAGFTITLEASQVALSPGQTVTLTARPIVDLGGDNDRTVIRDVTAGTAGTVVAVCDLGPFCRAPVTLGVAIRTYVATIEPPSATDPPPFVLATSDPVQVTWLAVNLHVGPAVLTPGGTTTLSASAPVDVGPTPWFIEIFDLDAGIPVAICGSGDTCSTSILQSDSTVRTYQAFISRYGLTLHPPDERASSDGVTASWLTIGLSSFPEVPNLFPGLTVTLTATSSLDVGPTQIGRAHV